MGSTTQGVKLDDNLRKRLMALGELRDRAPHWLMRQAVERYLDQEERVEREKQEDLERWEHFELTGEAVPHAEVKKWLGALASGKPAKCPK